MHETLLLCLGLLLTVCLLIILSQRLRLPYPILLVLGGLALSFVPGLPLVKINPDLIFLIFLPPLLYEAAWFTSWKDFWRWRRVISFLAFGLVFLTSGIVAYVSWAVIPGFTLALGFLLGGVVSPPDAVAATSVMRSMSLPRRIMAILEGESLVNDASSLIVFRFALAAVLSGSFVWYEAAGQFVLVTVLGVAVGLGIALVFYALHRWLTVTPSTHTVLTLITPYILYMTAEAVHASGVMAVVSGGLFLSYQSATIFTPANRRQGIHTWATVGFVLNGAVFMLIGLQLPLIINSLGAYSKLEAIGYGLLISFVVIVTRLITALLSSHFTHWVSRYITVGDANPGWRGPVIVGCSGMRGVVSLAAALSIPLLDNAGRPFPERNMVLFITFIVILMTLVGQGLTLPWLIRWVGVEDLDHLQPEHEQQRAVRSQLIAQALDTLNEQYATQVQRSSLVGALKQKLEKEAHLSTHQLPAVENDEQEVTEYYHIYSELIGVQRQALLKLRSQEEYDDDVIRKQETQLDLEEERLLLLMEAQSQAPTAPPERPALHVAK
ncbi:Na+/H+ antiporter [Hymenobacter crusticola]|uniref:Na+/H+ antiporter n=1 Tax=Hymenobacter crusticola TaxID=1770526 RepID=A0A243WCU6_9BACT|nr:Na+/H+ antiporter [Hymenobacter crusticola]OUJ73481.1 Na+/H+ antiporter [Hymenobacter crusticola]